MTSLIAWDIGGAHIKVARWHKHDDTLHAAQYPCALWRDAALLTSTVKPLLQQWDDDQSATHLLTMSGEMADCFASRHEGVRNIIKQMTQMVQPLLIYASDKGFVSSDETTSPDLIASMNWHATMSWLRHRFAQNPSVVMVDCGSTTTDCHPLHDTAPLSDFDRLRRKLLVYRGIIRTPLMALASHIAWRGETISLMAEHFATTADVFRILGTLPEEYDQWDTCDGKPKTQQDSIRRMIRMVGCDAAAVTHEDALALAHAFKELCKNDIKQCLKQCLHPLLKENSVIVGCGIGDFLMREVADDLGCRYRSFHEEVSASCGDGAAINGSAPAVSLICLFKDATRGASMMPSRVPSQTPPRVPT